MYCNNVMISPFQQTGLNVYDVRKKCDVNKNPLCYDIANDIDHYLNTAETQKQLGVKRQYKSCQMNINLRFMLAGDWMKPCVFLFLRGRNRIFGQEKSHFESWPCLELDMSMTCLLFWKRESESWFTLEMPTTFATGRATRPGRLPWTGRSAMALWMLRTRSGSPRSRSSLWANWEALTSCRTSECTRLDTWFLMIRYDIFFEEHLEKGKNSSGSWNSLNIRMKWSTGGSTAVMPRTFSKPSCFFFLSDFAFSFWIFTI